MTASAPYPLGVFWGLRRVTADCRV